MLDAGPTFPLSQLSRKQVFREGLPDMRTLPRSANPICQPSLWPCRYCDNGLEGSRSSFQTLFLTASYVVAKTLEGGNQVPACRSLLCTPDLTVNGPGIPCRSHTPCAMLQYIAAESESAARKTREIHVEAGALDWKPSHSLVSCTTLPTAD
ncbi:hypothetical protein K466DRAFT_397471 [Polyporus arcularius HHB13444]|uniref:Uncharacterized protein n=1 Tax=Polyporus arcularius HHB13444 TaxID=1314778 RepID=A0A5C3PXF6_9APHY|nr:hypothetical protein K466DRAFT_397471 [Polyporus arcularius HHB13444]